MNEFSLSDLAAVVGNGRNGNGNDGWGDGGGWWILLLFILLGGFNGNRGYGNGGGYGAGNVGGNELYPWLNNAENVNAGFRDQMIQTGIQGINAGVQNLATQLCQCCGDMQMALANGFAGVNLGMSNGFAGVQQSLCNGFNGTNVALLEGFNNVEAGANARQMANMQTAFGMQSAMQQGFNAAQAQTAQFAYDTGLGMAQQTATILAEHCSDRAALSDGVRDIIAANQQGTQAIIDKLCQLELDGYKRQVADEQRANADLRSQLTQAQFAASQQAQNAFIAQGFANEVDQLYQRLNTCPVPTTPVYGRTPIFTCSQNPNCPCMGN
jgi:hypothetical protein